jgi:predicted nucleic acid-binding protein
MICFDTNIIIYIANGSLDESIVTDDLIVYPSIARIESLGYANIRSIEEQKIRGLLKTLDEIPLTDAVIERSIMLRQDKRMNLGDAVVAATAIENNCELWTANVDDFSHIQDLKIVNPLLR